MGRHRLTITQTCRVERVIEIEVEAPTLEDAIAQQEQDDAPDYDDPRWLEYPDLMHERVEPA